MSFGDLFVSVCTSAVLALLFLVRTLRFLHLLVSVCDDCKAQEAAFIPADQTATTPLCMLPVNSWTVGSRRFYLTAGPAVHSAATSCVCLCS